MAPFEAITSSLANLSITPTATVQHASASAPQAWRESLEASSSAPSSFELIKIVVYKPKTAKTATPVPVVIIASEKVDYTAASVARKLGVKDPRIAAEDLLGDFFGQDKASREWLHSWP